MTDKEIVSLFFNKDNNAISVASEKFGAYCKKIAMNILGNNCDAEECVNDTFLKTWNSIPPQNPENLSAYLGKITRNISLDIHRKRNAEKRNDGNITAVLDELSDCLPLYGADVEAEFDRAELSQTINDFLRELPQDKRQIFVCRYFHSASVSEIAQKIGKSSGNVSVILARTRAELKKYLEKGGFTV